MKEKLLKKYICGAATATERAAVLAWAEASDANMAEYRFLHMAYASVLMDESPERYKERPSSVRTWTWVAAVAAVLVAVLALFVPFSSTVSVQSVCAPLGQQTKVDLSDGTVVWLNSGSSIEFGDLDCQRIRHVNLVGEAMFSVAKDTKRPFLVHTGDFDVKVLGTRFNVNTYNNEKTVVLVDGAVDVICGRDRFSITPGKMYSYNQETRESRIQDVHTDNYVSWVNGYLLFDNITLGTVLSQVQSFFGVNIEYDMNKASETRVSGKLELRDGLDTALLNLKNTNILSFEKVGEEKIIIRIND